MEKGFTKISGISREEICDKLRKNGVEEFTEDPVLAKEDSPVLTSYISKCSVLTPELALSKIRKLQEEIGSSIRTKIRGNYVMETYRAEYNIDSIESLEDLNGLLHIIDGKVIEETIVIFKRSTTLY